MSNDSEDSVKKEDLISNFDQEVNVDYISQMDIPDDPFLPIDQQIAFLNNKYTSLKEILVEDKEIKGNKNLNFVSEEEIIKNPNLLKQILLENVYYRNKISSVESINNSLLSQISNIQKEMKEKDEEIQLLKDDINNIKVEKTDSMYQVKSILKDFDLYSKYATGNTSRFNLGNGTHIAAKHGVNRESMSSVGTNSTSNSTIHPQIEFDKLQKEKAVLENQLVMYKFKYAEQSSKIIELEDERDMYKKKYEASSEKMRIKEEIIKSLIQERDSLRTPSLNSSKTRNNHHKIPTGNMSHRGTHHYLTHTQYNRSPERMETIIAGSTPIHIETEFVNDIVNSSMVNSSHLHTEINAPSGSKTPGGFVKIFKNIFSSEKK